MHVKVRAHERRLPERKPDRLAAEIEARRKAFQRKWKLEIVEDNDDRLRAPIPKPSHRSRYTLGQIREQLYGVLQLMKKIARM